MQAVKTGQLVSKLRSLGVTRGMVIRVSLTGVRFEIRKVCFDSVRALIIHTPIDVSERASALPTRVLVDGNWPTVFSGTYDVANLQVEIKPKQIVFTWDDQTRFQ